MPEKTQKTSAFNNFTVVDVSDLNYFDLSGENTGTKGTSSKSYHIELQKCSTDNRYQIYSSYGATGAKQAQDWRYYSDLFSAQKDFKSIVNSKIKKGYKLIEVAQRTIGSEEAKSIVKPVELKNIEKSSVSQSFVDKNVRRLVEELLGATTKFVATTLKCPLGQLTNAQVDKGRSYLEEAKLVLESKKNDVSKLQSLTNDFYATIPHNLGAGFRGQMNHLLLDDVKKIAQKEQDLDDLLDAKSIGAVSVSDDIDAKYKSLNCRYDYLEHESNEYKWVNDLFVGTRAHNHSHFGKLILLDVWKMSRNNEQDIFNKNLDKISKQDIKQFVPDVLKKFLSNRPIDKNISELYKRTNTFPLWHGTRSSSLVGITKNGFLIKPANVICVGSMLGNASSYYAPNSSKSINYTSIKGAYYTQGTEENGYMFLTDCILGNPVMAKDAYMYSQSNIKPNHSVYAKSGVFKNLYNDEMTLYDPSGENQQFNITYIVKFTTKNGY